MVLGDGTAGRRRCPPRPKHRQPGKQMKRMQMAHSSRCKPDRALPASRAFQHFCFPHLVCSHRNVLQQFCCPFSYHKGRAQSHGFLQDRQKPVFIVPLYLSYRPVEVGCYVVHNALVLQPHHTQGSRRELMSARAAPTVGAPSLHRTQDVRRWRLVLHAGSCMSVRAHTHWVRAAHRGHAAPFACPAHLPAAYTPHAHKGGPCLVVRVLWR